MSGIGDIEGTRGRSLSPFLFTFCFFSAYRRLYLILETSHSSLGACRVNFRRCQSSHVFFGLSRSVKSLVPYLEGDIAMWDMVQRQGKSSSLSPCIWNFFFLYLQKEHMIKAMKNRTWVVFANESICDHRKAIKELGLISWTMKQSSKFEIGDIVYLFMSDDRSIRFKMEVADSGVDRLDGNYWIEVPDDKTYQLDFVSEYKGDLLREDLLVKHGFNGGGSILNPSCNNTKLISYIDSVFNSHMRKTLPEYFMVVDLNSGRYLHNKTGHEYFNLTPNEVDGRFYGYCPPWDETNINKLGAKQKDEFVEHVMVIYTVKVGKSSDRKIVAFTDNAKVYRESIDNRKLNRYILENKKKVYCTYTIESDYIYDLREEKDFFIIHIKDYNVSMFRRQRFYSGKYPELDRQILKYLTDYVTKKERSSEEDLSYQEEIQNQDEHEGEFLTETYKKKPSYINSQKGRVVNKNSRISKQALLRAAFKCQFNERHNTFETANGVPYMEGHHLIPCTATNSEYYWADYGANIDCEENIVCLCPTCHRRIHFGSKEEKYEVIQELYKKQASKLKDAGIKISLKELEELYD